MRLIFAILVFNGMKSAPVGRVCEEPFNIILNEVKYGDQQTFIELSLTSETIQTRQGNTLGKFGLVAVEFNRKRKKEAGQFQIHAAIDLTGLSWQPGNEFFLIGPENSDIHIPNNLHSGQYSNNHHSSHQCIVIMQSRWQKKVKNH